MNTDFSPQKGKSLAINGVVAALLIAAILFFLISGSMRGQGWLSIVFIGVGLLLLVPLALAIYRIITISTTIYSLSRDALEVKWGLRRELIPMREITWVHPVSDFETPLPLGFTLVKGSYYVETSIKGLGKTLFVATAPEQMVLIKLSEAYLVISPKDKLAFTEDYKQLSQLGSLQSIQPESENLRMLWGRVMDERVAKRLLLGGAISFFVLLISTAIIVGLQQQVVWVSMETVPSSRLFLLALIGLFFSILNTLIGLFLYLQERAGKTVVYLILGWSILINIILTMAMIFMSV
ncbi:MAG TPA: hypothetical protein DD636_03210 [Anaerolineaceae bacterium]|jgi:MFS family permease|nr:hypothetical protein [Anaerolineaceae bacterium]